MPWWWEAFRTGQTTASIWRVEVWIPYLAVPVGLALLCLQALADLAQVLGRRDLPFGLKEEDRL